MFKSGKPSKPPRKPGGGAALMHQMGFQIPNLDGSGAGDDDDDDDGDDDLEAELMRLQQDAGGGAASRRSKGGQQASGGGKPNLQAIHNDVNKLLRDIDQPINDDDLSDVDEDDLLAELNEITDEIENDSHDQPAQAKSPSAILALLAARQDMYTKALAASKASGDGTKARRLERQLKSIQELLQSARAGAHIDESEIPPEVFFASQPAAAGHQPAVRAPSPPVRQPAAAPAPQPRVVPKPQPPAPAPSRGNDVVFRAPAATSQTDPAVARLKSLALEAKNRGDMGKAKEYILQLRALQGGGTATAAAPSRPSLQRESYDNVPDDDEPPPPLPLKAPEPRTVMEALQQRHEELTKRGEEAAGRGDTSKSRRMERLSKQYEEAIDATRKGRSYDYNELPDIPGFGPIPAQAVKPAPAAGTGQPAAHPPARTPQGQQQQRAMASASSSTSTTKRKSQQAQILRLKQDKFQKLALQAKQQGDIETAKKFLIAYKGLEQMIQAAESGLPVDMSQVPILPDDDTDMINDDDLTQDLAHADRETVYRRLQDDLLRQMQLCVRNQQIYAQMDGNEAARSASEHKALEQRCAHDLEKIRQCFQHGLKPPLFHYERRQLNVIQTNNDLGENDLEVTVLRGINLPVPAGHTSASLETYVTIEFPYPTDEPQMARTRHIADANNAEYPESQHKFYIKRNDAKFRRLMNRKELRFAVFYKPGFLRSDRPLGTASLKLAQLEHACTIHESVDLYECEHKKKIEGKLEIKLRIREALEQTKASEILPQRWLVIDRFPELPSSNKPSTSNRSQPAEQSSGAQHRRSHAQPLPVSAGPQSVQVLNYEASLLHQQIDQYQDRLSPEQMDQLQTKLRRIETQSDQLVESLRTGGRRAVQDHLRGLEELIDHYDQEAREYHQRRDTKKAEIYLTKKKLVMKEIDTLTGQPPPTVSSRF